MESNKKRYAILLIGPPGSGKSSVASNLEQKKNVAVVGTGNLLREEAAKGTALGEKISPILKEGKLVPTDIVTQVISKKINLTKNHFILFDGFPRTKEQIKPLFNIYNESGLELHSVFIMDIKRETAVKRLSGRRVCTSCGEIYNIYFNPPPEKNRCKCGNKLEMRDDDKPEIVEKRLEDYEKNTAPIIKHFQEFFPDKIFFIDGEKTIDEATEEIISKL